MKSNPTVRCYLTLLGVLLVTLPSALPAHAGLFSINADKERKMGDDAAREIDAHSRVVSGPVADWVTSIGERLAKVSDPEFKYSFRVIDSPEINAFALPGGYVYVYTGLRKITKSDDELAAILGHEITHAEQHHFARQYSKDSKRGIGVTILSAVLGLPNAVATAVDIVNSGISAKYSRGNESEADYLGMQRMVRAGFDPHAMVTLLEKLSNESPDESSIDKWFGDHPEGPKRVAAAKREEAELRVKAEAKAADAKAASDAKPDALH